MKYFLAFASRIAHHYSSTYKSSLRTFQTTAIVRISAKNQNNFAEHQVEIKTCGDLYEKWRQEKKFWRIPNGDLTFKVSFIDTHRDVLSEAPVALALHGAPGSYKDFSLLTSHLFNQGIRMVVPSFPDFKAYKPGVFRHSAEERAQFLKDFLKTIGISQIDAIICHSSAVYPSLILSLENSEPRVKSLAMLNPGVYGRMRATRPYWLMSATARASEYFICLKFIEFFGPLILKTIVKSPVRVDNFLDPLLSACVMTHANIPKAKDRLLQLSSSKFPFFFAFSEDDKLVDSKESYIMANLLGAEEHDMSYVNKAGAFIRDGKENTNLKVMVFENGSHYVFWKYSEIINEALTEFLSKHALSM